VPGRRGAVLVDAACRANPTWPATFHPVLWPATGRTGTGGERFRRRRKRAVARPYASTALKNQYRGRICDSFAAGQPVSGRGGNCSHDARRTGIKAGTGRSPDRTRSARGRGARRDRRAAHRPTRSTCSARQPNTGALSYRRGEVAGLRGSGGEKVRMLRQWFFGAGGLVPARSGNGASGE